MEKQFIKVFESLPKSQQDKILKWYEVSCVQGLVRRAKEFAKDQIYWADKKGYGYGEMGYYFAEEQKNMEEKEFSKPIAEEYINLCEAYFDKLVEVEKM